MKFVIWFLYITLNVACFNTLEKARDIRENGISPYRLNITNAMVASQDPDTITISGSGRWDQTMPRVLLRASSDTYKPTPHPICWDVKVGSMTIKGLGFVEATHNFIIRIK